MLMDDDESEIDRSLSGSSRVVISCRREGPAIVIVCLA
jgi:hypothetical protein